MRLSVSRWGNSLAIRLPRGVVQDVHLCEGSEVDVTVEDGRVVLTPARAAETLSTLLALVTDTNRHGEVDSGAPVGKEVW